MAEQRMNKDKPEMECKVESDDEDEDDDDEDDDNVFLDDGGGGMSAETDDCRKVLYDMVRSMEQSMTDGYEYHHLESVSDDRSNGSESPCHSPSMLSFATPCSSSDPVGGDLGQLNCATTGEPRNVFRFGGDLFRTEQDFVDYLVSLPSSNTKEEIGSKPQTTTTTLLKPIKVAQPPTTTTTTQGSGSQSLKVGLDHLENLCKLMEQLGELREQNCKLQKRVQYLEEMRCLNEMRKDLKEALEAATATSLSTPCHDDDDDDDDEEEEDCDDNVKLRKSNVKKRTKQRGRSQSMEMKNESTAAAAVKPGPATAILGSQVPTTRKAKISKWTKVKEALKWERASPMEQKISTVNTAKDAHHQSAFYVDDNNDDDDDDGNLQPPLMVSKASVTLRSPANKKSLEDSTPHSQSRGKMPAIQRSDAVGDDVGSGDSLALYLSRDSYLETSSEDDAAEDIQRTRYKAVDKRQSMGALLTLEEPSAAAVARRQSSPIRTRINIDVKCDQGTEAGVDRKGRSLDRNMDPKLMVKQNQQSEKESMKMAKKTWGRMKNIIQARKDSLKRKHRKSSASDQTICEPSRVTSNDAPAAAVVEDSFNWYDMDSEFYYDVPPSGQSRTSKHSSSSSNYGTDNVNTAASSTKPAIAKRPQQLNIVQSALERPCGSSVPIPVNEYSPTSSKSKWANIKKVFSKKDDEAELRPHSDPSSPTNPTSFYYDDIKSIEGYLGEDRDWTTEPKSAEYATAATAIQRILAEDKSGPSELHHHQQQQQHQQSSSSDPAQYPLSTDARRNLEELQRNISHDFCKKLEEWEKLRSASSHKQLHQQQQHQPSALSRKGSNKAATPKVKPEKVKHRDKELQWLQKQLQKIEREKLRLAKERQKYLEREARLEKMKETMMTSSPSAPPPPPLSVKKEVLIKTSAGEFRFEGISQTFTRKLYEWEAMKGIGPEVSTIALLDSQQSFPPKRAQSTRTPIVTDFNSLSPPTVRYGGGLARSRSHSDSSIADIANVQTSTTSLQVFEDHEDTDEPMGHSRSNSEPDMLFTHSDEPACAVEVEELHYEEFVPCTEIPALHIEEPVYSYTPVSDVTHLVDSSCHGSDIGIAHRNFRCPPPPPPTSDLTTTTVAASATPSANRNNEDVCRHLESELKDIDGQMKIMFQKQSEEIREDDEKQLELLGELRTRIMEIEKASKIIKDKRDENESEHRYADGSSKTTSSAKTYKTPEVEIPKISDRPKLSGKKKEGVVKIQSLSSELLQQAKVLEEALLERNATIRKLQWELVQRDVTKPNANQECANLTTDKTKKVGNHSHSRSWSSADAAQHRFTTCDKNKDPKPPATAFLASTNNSEVAILPVELTRKVRELKTELMRLWSSGDSSTSEQGSDEKSPEVKMLQMDQDAPFNCSKLSEDRSKNVASFEETESRLNREPGSKLPPEEASKKTTEDGVIARRALDVVGLRKEFGQQQRTGTRCNISWLPRSPDFDIQNGSSKMRPDPEPVPPDESAFPFIEQKTQPKTTTTSRFYARSPTVLARSNVIPKPCRTKDATRDRPTGETAVDSKVESATPPTSAIPVRCPSQTAIKSPSASNIAMSPRDTPKRRTSKTGNGKGQTPFLRQNAEDLVSSSDTDTEESGVTFTIDVGRKQPEKPERRTRVQAPIQKPPRTFIRRDVAETVEPWTGAITKLPPASISAGRSPGDDATTNGDVIKGLTNNACNLLTPTRSRRPEILPSPLTAAKKIEESEELAKNKPETPVMKSRSTRKLKFPTSPKVTEFSTSSPPPPPPSIPVPEPSPVILRKGFIQSVAKEPSPNVKMMVEKFNMKIDQQEQHQPSQVPRSPLTRLQRRWISSPGVQKSNSFREKAAPQTTPATDSVVKSASASTVEGRSTNKGSSMLRFPQSPTFSAKSRTCLGQQPVGIASRIPRSLKSILEQDSAEGSKESQEVDAEVNEKRFFLLQSPRTANGRGAVTSSKASTSSSPSSSSSTSSTTDQHHFTSPMTPPITTKLPIANKQMYGRTTAAPEVTSPKVTRSLVMDNAQHCRSSSSSSEIHEESNIKVLKSASAGMMDAGAEPKPTTSTRSTEDLTSSRAQQLQKSGLFNFKFRKAKMKQKKEPLNTVKALCRQSLVVDIHGRLGTEDGGDDGARRVDSDEARIEETSTAIPISSKSCPSSPELQSKQITKSGGGWLTKPKILFRSK